MRTSTLILLTVAWTAVAPLATSNPLSQAADPTPVPLPAAEVRGEVIGVDAEKKTLKLKTNAGGESAVEMELTVEGDAAKDLQAGDQVVVTCKEETSGDKCVVAAVKKSDSQ